VVAQITDVFSLRTENERSELIVQMAACRLRSERSFFSCILGYDCFAQLFSLPLW
jgi:hypothetical protein